MKVLLTCIAILIVGLLSGRHIGVLCSKHETREAVEQFVQAMESSEGAEAARDVRAIELIEGGNNEAAVRLLCSPIATYYLRYDPALAADARRLKLRGMIAALSSTNKIVAAEINNYETNIGLKSVR